jgi:hypothetical protein
MDRFDIHIEVPRVDYEKLSSDRLGEPSEQIRTRVEAARAVQQELLVDAALSGNARSPFNVWCSMPRSSRWTSRTAFWPNPWLPTQNGCHLCTSRQRPVTAHQNTPRPTEPCMWGENRV